MSIHILKEKRDNLHFVFQPIIKSLSPQEHAICSHEVLLRSKGKTYFPNDIFMEFIQNEEANGILLERYTEMVHDYMQKFLKTELSLNLHQQQLSYESTWVFLESIRMYAYRITIEVTEFLPENYADNAKEIRSWMEQLKHMGFKISLDDVSSGLNSMQFVMDHIDLLTTIKFSFLPFQRIRINTLLLFLKGWIGIANQYQVNLVVEAVESEEIAVLLQKMGVEFQQGFYWGRGIAL